MNYLKAIIRSTNVPIELEYVSTHTRLSDAAVSASYQCNENELHCSLCAMNFGQKSVEHREHLNHHRESSILKRQLRGTLHECNTNESNDLDDIEPSTCLVQLCTPNGNLKLTCINGRITSSITMELKNISSHSIHMTDLYLFNQDVAIAVLDAPDTIAPGLKLEINLINASNHAGKLNDYVARYILIPSQTELIEVHRLNRCCHTLALRSKRFREEYFDSKEMGADMMPTEDEAVITLKPSNYVNTFTRLIHLEEYANYLEMMQYNCKITFTKETLQKRTIDVFALTIPNVSTKFPMLNIMDQFWMIPENFEHDEQNWVQATVVDIGVNDLLLIRVRKQRPVADQTYKIEFIVNRIPFQMEHRALQAMEQLNVIDWLFPATVPPYGADKQPDDCQQLEWFNENIKKNLEQRQAVMAIVNEVSYPAPYLLFGPPGTGKTATVTEAICQLLRTQPSSRILVTATSNAAADELTLRLLKYLTRNSCYFDHNCYRLYAACVRREVDNELLLANSNYGLGFLPCWTVLQKYRVIVCTLATAGRLVLEKPHSSERHFTHLFVDECGSATETAVLVPIAVCSSPGRINVQIVLSGDPKQLGPVIQSRTAEQMGLGQSLIERLMNRREYQRDEITQTYCSRMLTQLLQNFRSHPDIINISNDLFYDGKLLARAPKERSHCCVGWYFLPMRSVPILFDVTVGYAQKEENSTSWFNNKEVGSVVHYVNLLLKYGINGKQISEDDIGIISPYKRQCHKIEMALKNRGHQKIMIASVELFQGREKPVIIVSTVRTGRQGIGFLDSPKRLNVLLTRAQALMILIGDPNVLQKDPNWYDVLERLTRLRVMTGTRFVLSAVRPTVTNEDDQKHGNTVVSSTTTTTAAVQKMRNDERLNIALAALRLI